MSKTLLNRMVSVFLSLCLVLALITTGAPLGVMPALHADTIYNLTDSGDVVISEAGDYVISGSTSSNNITVNSGITGDVNLTLNGVSIDVSSTNNKSALSVGENSTVNLTLAGDNTLRSANFRAGVQVPQNATLIITQQSTGTLVATSNHAGAGIGGGSGSGGTITINGGNITANGGDHGAGIGGSGSGSGGTITINGGTVSATSNFGGAGIGGGNGGDGGSITINGGTVSATGGFGGADIGGGSGGSGGTISITGGTVTATGDYGGAGIGSGMDGSGASTTITGGSVKANSVNPQPTNGISPVYQTAVTVPGILSATPVTYSVDGGDTISTFTHPDGKLYLWLAEGERTLTVTANGNTYGAVRTIAANNTNTVLLAPVPVITESNVSVTGAVDTFQTGDTVTVRWDNSLSGDNNNDITDVTVDFSAFGGGSDAVATEVSDIWTATYIIQSGTLIADNCSVAVTATNGSGNQATYHTPGYAVNNTMLNISQGNIIINTAGTYTVIGSTTSNSITVNPGITGDVNLTLNNVNINVSSTHNKAALSVGANSTLNLTLTGNNTLRSGNFCAGVQVPQNATLVITQQSSGSLVTTGGTDGAGIGGNYGGSGGTITIHGGIISATGNYGAGIGGGLNGSGGTITINGGIITATGNDGAGIGGGDGGSGGTISIHGGTVTATGGTYGAGIGGNGGGSGGSITIHGGTVTATGGTYSAGIGGGDRGSGGNITINGGSIAAISNTGGAGIGGGWNGSGGTINITDGTVTATSNGGAGIGGGLYSSGGTISITGGTVTATGNSGGAGIGGGSGGSGGTTTITGGSVKANSVNPQPTNGISPVYHAIVTVPGILSATPVTYSVDGGDTISTFTHPDGKLYLWLAEGECTLTVTANGKPYAVSLTVVPNNTNTVTATPVPVITESNVTVTGASGADGTFQTGDIVAVTWDNSSSGDDNETITAVAVDFSAFGGGSAVAASKNIDLWTATYIIQSGALVTDNCSVAVTATNGSGNQATYHTPGYAVNNTMLNISQGNIIINTAGTYTVIGSTTSNSITVNPGITGDVNLTLNNVNINVSSTHNKAALSVGTNSTVNLTLIGSNTLRSGDNCAGVQVPQNATLVITQQSTGTLNAYGGYCGAGIGGGDYGSGGTVTINGGSVTATGDYAAGIGGGYYGNGGTVSIHGGTVTATGNTGAAGIGSGQFGNDGSVTIHGGVVFATGNYGAGIGGGQYGSGGSTSIHGGTVTATGNNGGAGIGSGQFGNDGSVTIHGGTVTATGNNGSAGIGGGYYGSGGTISISGGTVAATRGSSVANDLGSGAYGSFGSIAITGGSVKANTISPAPTNGISPVYRVAVTTGTLTEQADVSYKVDFGANSSIATHPDGKLYLWLTSRLHQVSVTHNSVDYSSAAEIAPTNSNTLTLGLARALTLSPFTATYTGSPIAYAGRATANPALSDGERLTYTYFATAADREAVINPMLDPPTKVGTYYILGLLPTQDPYGSVLAYTTMTIKKATPSSPGSWGGNSRYVQDEDIYTGSGHTSVTLTGEATTLTAQQVDSLITQNATAPIIIRGAGYTVTFPTGSMRESLGGRSLNLSLVFNWASDRYTTIKPLAGTGFVMLLDFLHSGALPGTANIRVNVGTAYAGKTLYYYYYNPEYKAFEYRQAGVVDAAGFITLSQSSCSQYVLSTTALSNERPGIPETGGGEQAPTRSAPLLFTLPVTRREDEQPDADGDDA